MESPQARLLGALILMAMFYRALLDPSVKAVETDSLFDAEFDALVESSRTQYNRGRYEEALAPTLALVERFPAQHVYLGRLATIYHELHRYTDEAATWHRFMDNSPTPWEACPAVADAHRAQGDEPSATRAFEECWRLAPWDADQAFFLARARERNGQVQDAAALYKAALELNASHADSKLGLARLALWANRIEDARLTAVEVAERFPSHPDALLLIGLAAQRSGDTQKAREYFNRTLGVAESYADAHIGLGIVEFGEDHISQARQHFERALDVDSSRRAELAVWLARTGSKR